LTMTALRAKVTSCALQRARIAQRSSRSFTAITDKHFYQPDKGHGLRHNPLNSIIAPRPIGWIGSVGKSGDVNLAPYSFFNVFNYRPPIIGFSSIGFKDSVRNISETGAFTWNLVTRALGEQMNQTSDLVEYSVNEFNMAGLTEAPSKLVTAPRVGESPVNFECRVSQVFQLTNAEGSKLETWMVLGEVVGVHIDRELIKDGIYDMLGAEPIMRAGGPAGYYGVSANDYFELHRRHVHPETPE